MRQIQELVSDGVALSGLDGNHLMRRRAAAEADAQGQALFEHELVKALHSTCAAALDLDGKDMGACLQQVVDFRVPAAFPSPVVDLSDRCGVAGGEPQLLGRDLLGQSAPNLRRKPGPTGETSARRSVSQAVSQAHIQ